MSELPALRFDAVDAIIGFDTGTAGLREFNAVYLIPGPEPTLVETASAADAAGIVTALEAEGLGPNDLAHLVVTHIHLDHAGGAGHLVRAYPRAKVWVHERGAAHLADPARLVASTSRTYGPERMAAYYGTTLPVPETRINAIADGDRIPIGARSLRVVHTPGHASHHVALHDDRSDVVFTGEAVGSHLPWADAYRPALPPPEVDVERALASIDRIRMLRSSALLTTHFGPILDPEEGCARAADRVRAWSETVRDALERDLEISDDALRTRLVELASLEFLADAGRPIDLERYDAIGSIGMNAAGLARYWRKRWDREGRDDRLLTGEGET